VREERLYLLHRHICFSSQKQAVKLSRSCVCVGRALPRPAPTDDALGLLGQSIPAAVRRPWQRHCPAQADEKNDFLGKKAGFSSVSRLGSSFYWREQLGRALACRKPASHHQLSITLLVRNRQRAPPQRRAGTTASGLSPALRLQHTRN